jgi:type II secretion system protein N
MEKILKNTYQWYILYGILLTACLLYFCFPSDTFRDYFIKTVSSTNPQVLVSVEDVRPSLALGVKFLNAELSPRTNPEIQLFSAESITIKPGIGSFFGGKSSYRFDCQGYGGNIKGTFQFEKNNLETPLDASITLEDIYIDDFIWLSTLTGYNPKGTLNGTITLERQSNLLIHGTGEANLKISDGSVALKEPFLDFESINFDEIQVKLALKNRNIELSHFNMRGQEIQGTLSGTIRLNRDFLKSRLELDGNIELLEAVFNRNKEDSDKNAFMQGSVKLPFKITGTIEAPEFKFS